MSTALFDLTGKIALVTGSTQGIGFAIARGLAEANATVILNGRNTDKLKTAANELRKNGFPIYESCFDVNDEKIVSEAIEKILQDIGDIDILVNNAGVIKRVAFADMELSLWNEVLQTDLTSAFIVSKAVVKKMIHRQSGKIINICSLMSEVGRDTVSAYAAAKGGLKMLTKNMATELGGYNIQVNGIGPGFIATPINTEYRATGNPLNEFIISRTPANRWGTPEDLAGACIFLASEASDFVNGQILYIDGGLLATIGKPILK